MNNIKKSAIRVLVAVMFLIGGLASGNIMNVNTSSECPREACNDDDKCEWYGNMTTCSDNGSCDHGVCNPPPSTDPGVHP